MNLFKFYFESPKLILLVLLIIPAWLFLFSRWKHCSSGIKLLAGSSIGKVFLYRVLFWSFGWIFLCLALGNPFCGSTTQTEKRQGASVVLVYDISESMNCEDCFLVNKMKQTSTGLFDSVLVSRLTMVSVWSKAFIQSIYDIPLGVILAKGKPVLSIPLTTDKQAIDTLISQLSTKLSGFPGTDLGEAVKMASKQLESSVGTKNTIIVITDGGDLEGNLLSVVAKIPSDIQVIFIGVGGSSPVPVPLSNGDVLREKNGEPIRTVLESEELIKAAELCDGKYFSLSDSDNVKKIADLVCSSEIMNGTYVMTNVSKSCRWFFVLLAFLCLIIGMLFEKRNVKAKKTSLLNIICLISFVVVFSTSCSETKASFSILEGYLDWKSGDYDMAVVNFMKADSLGEELNDKSISSYAKLGLALSYMQQNEEDVAFALLEDLAVFGQKNSDKKLVQNVFYAAGTAAYQKADYDKAVKYFSDVIVAGDNSLEVRLNLELSQRSRDASQETSATNTSSQLVKKEDQGSKIVFDIFSEKEFNVWMSPEGNATDSGKLDY